MARKRKHSEHASAAVDQSSALATSQNLTPAEITSLRRKKSAATRIGRACDRCQHRKLACDPAPEGCPPCLRVNAWCTVTDPLTGIPTYRGEFDFLTHKVAKQRQDIEELLGRLRTLGEDVTPYLGDDAATKQYLRWTQVKASGDTRPWDRDGQTNGSRPSGLQQIPVICEPLTPTSRNATAGFSLPPTSLRNDPFGLPDLRDGIAGYNYLGISTIKTGPDKLDSNLNMLGWEINLADFATKDGEGSRGHGGHGAPPNPRTYESFLNTAFGNGPVIPKVALPPRPEGMQYAESYIQVLNAFLPILHGPSFINLLTKCYDDLSFKPSPAEEVIVHMLFASMFYQDGARNWEVPKRQLQLHILSDEHYHYSLSMLGRLMGGYTLQDVQALAMICAHVRNFPKPEVSWLIINMTWNKMIELDFHKSPKAKEAMEASIPQRSILEIEMRKRVFWVIVAIHVTISGKLGRPMVIRDDEYDVELPLALDDNLLSENGIDTSKPGTCAFRLSIEIFKLEPIFMDLYRTIYALKRSPKEYPQFIGIAGKRLQKWIDQWPAEFRDERPRTHLQCVFVKYLHLWVQEYRLLLYHPSLSMTKSPQLNDTNLRACLAAAQEMLQNVKGLQELKSLDTTWYNCAVYILAIQTTLYGHGQLKDELTPATLQTLRSDMNDWIGIMGDIGGLLDSGRQLQGAIRKQVNKGMTQLERYVVEKTGSPELKLQNNTKDRSPEVAATSLPPSMNRSDRYGDANHFNPYADPNQHMHGYNESPASAPPEGQLINQYSSMGPYAYPDVPNPTYNQPVPISASTMPAAYVQPSYSMDVATEALSSAYSQQGQPIGEMDCGFVPMNQPYQHPNVYGADSQSWFQYTQTIPSATVPQDYNPASALLQLGGRSDQGMHGVMTENGGTESNVMSGGAGQMWPLVVMNPDPGGGGQ